MSLPVPLVNSGVRADDVNEIRRSTPNFDYLSAGQAREKGVLLVEECDELCLLCARHPEKDDMEWIRGLTFPRPFRIQLAPAEPLMRWLNELDADRTELSAVVADAPSLQDPTEEGQRLIVGTAANASHPIARLLDSTLIDALNAGASDIHLVTEGASLHIQFRIDGILTSAAHIAGLQSAEQLISRIKVLSRMDISERRRPQDGRFTAVVDRRAIDMRVSMMPNIHGEDAVLRILDKSQLVKEGADLTLDALGLTETNRQWLRNMMALPYGMFLVTGPTGSGKTTTLYGLLSEFHSGAEKTITIEDPVEYELKGVLQIPVNPKKGLTFATGLRSILRHDPDRIMVGEIRDHETADIAVQAALTGHLVLTSVHANNTFDVIGRLQNMQVDPYTLASALNGVWAQRLMRRVCTHCAKPSEPDLSRMGIELQHQELRPNGHWVEGKGCEHCRFTGYRGRLAIAEMLTIDDGIRGLIAQRRPSTEIKAMAAARGTRLLREAALDSAARGESTIAEALRVTRHD